MSKKSRSIEKSPSTRDKALPSESVKEESSKLTLEEREGIINFLNKNSNALERTQDEINATRVATVPGGSVNMNYKASFPESPPLFLKKQVVKQEIYEDSLFREYNVLQVLKGMGIGVPQPLFYDKTENILVTSFIDGSRPELPNDQILVLIGQYLSQLRKAPITLLKRLCTGRRVSPRVYWLLDIKPRVLELQKSSLLSGSQFLFTFLHEMIQTLDLALQTEPREVNIQWQLLETNRDDYSWFTLLHNDFSLRNLIKADEKLIAVDWEFADAGDIAFDIATLLTENLITLDDMKIIINNIEGTTEQKNRIYVTTLRFRPIIELGNTYWTLKFIKDRLEGRKAVIRPSVTLSDNMNYVQYHIRQLASQLRFTRSQETVNTIFMEIQTALKLFQGNLILSNP